ncbi:hypothetical protein EYF80_050875 [Liparis tanakae]|uniref:Uncharacterized protein n=1 Tax=Liparis tanakae TaxID=230148 RepID=A0A4Z2FCS7_9TELE|nr:hypothetical protein EYF80_050875 [Liparis tanakae]
MRRVRRKIVNKEKVFGCDLMEHLNASSQESDLMVSEDFFLMSARAFLYSEWNRGDVKEQRRREGTEETWRNRGDVEEQRRRGGTEETRRNRGDVKEPRRREGTEETWRNRGDEKEPRRREGTEETWRNRGDEKEQVHGEERRESPPSLLPTEVKPDEPRSQQPRCIVGNVGTGAPVQGNARKITKEYDVSSC